MFSFTDYKREVWDVSSANNVDVGVGFSMFKAAVTRGAGDVNTERALPGYDFAPISADWAALDEDGQKAALDEWFEFVRTGYKAYCAEYAALIKKEEIQK